MLNSPVNGKIQGLFKTFKCFSSTFQDKFNFQQLFKTVLYIQVLFKPVRSLLYVLMDYSFWFELGMVHCINGGVTGYNFQNTIVFLSLKIANSVDQDEMLHYAAFHQALRL